MPKYYCDYCDTYLTHDSPSVRKTHCQGRKHKDNVKFYYQKWMEEQAQHLIDRTTADFKAGKIAPGKGPGVPIPPPAGVHPMGPPNITARPPPSMMGHAGMGHPGMGPMMMGPPGSMPPMMGMRPGPPMLVPMNHMGPMRPQMLATGPPPNLGQLKKM